MKLRMIPVFILALAFPFSASSFDSPYFFADLGLTDHSDMDIPVSLSEDPDLGLTVQANADQGLILGFGGGYHVSEYLRLEGEVGYRSSSIDNVKLLSVDIEGLGFEGGEGDLSSVSFTGNLWYDMDMESSWEPYFGGGLGFTRTSLEAFSIFTVPIVPDPSPTRWLIVDDSAWQFTYQFGAGMGYRLTGTAVITMDYRFSGSPKAEFTDLNGHEFKADNNSHNFLIGIRYSFGY